MLEHAAAAEEGAAAVVGAWPVEGHLVMPVRSEDSCLSVNIDIWTHMLLELLAIRSTHYHD